MINKNPRCNECMTVMEILPDLPGAKHNSACYGCKACDKIVEKEYGSLAGENPRILSVPLTHEEYMERVNAHLRKTKTFILFGDHPQGTSSFDGKYCIAVEAESEEAVAKHFGGRYEEKWSGLVPGIVLPRALFKPHYSILKFFKDGLVLYARKRYDDGRIIENPDGGFVRIQKAEKLIITE